VWVHVLHCGHSSCTEKKGVILGRKNEPKDAKRKGKKKKWEQSWVRRNKETLSQKGKGGRLRKIPQKKSKKYNGKWHKTKRHRGGSWQPRSFTHSTVVWEIAERKMERWGPKIPSCFLDCHAALETWNRGMAQGGSDAGETTHGGDWGVAVMKAKCEE